MALTGLDAIEWHKLSHAYGSAENIPDLLRALDKTGNNDDFEETYGELLNLINHQNDIYDSTAATIPFLIQIMEKSSESGRKLNLLLTLGSILRDIQSYPWGFFQHPHESPVIWLRSNIETYDAVARGVDSYLKLLFDDNEDIRFASLYILFALVEQREQILPVLVTCISSAKDKWFQACAVWTYVHLVKYSFHSNSKEGYLGQLVSWLKDESLPSLAQYAAAYGHLFLSPLAPASMTEYKPSTPQIVIKTVAEALKTNVWLSKGDVWGDRLDIYMEISPFYHPIHWIRKHNPHQPYTWIALLKELSLFPPLAHVCVSEILKTVFKVNNVGDSLPEWNVYSLYDTEASSRIYQNAVDANRYQAGRKLDANQIFALKAVVDCDVFWEIPTNLFSFFYGLPDDREELRKLLE